MTSAQSSVTRTSSTYLRNGWNAGSFNKISFPCFKKFAVMFFHIHSPLRNPLGSCQFYRMPDRLHIVQWLNQENNGQHIAFVRFHHIQDGEAVYKYLLKHLPISEIFSIILKSFA